VASHEGKPDRDFRSIMLQKNRRGKSGGPTTNYRKTEKKGESRGSQGKKGERWQCGVRALRKGSVEKQKEGWKKNTLARLTILHETRERNGGELFGPRGVRQRVLNLACLNGNVQARKCRGSDLKVGAKSSSNKI